MTGKLLYAHETALLGMAKLHQLDFQGSLEQFTIGEGETEKSLGLNETEILARIDPKASGAPLPLAAVAMLGLAADGRFKALAERVYFEVRPDLAKQAMAAYWPASRLHTYLIERCGRPEFVWQKFHAVRQLSLLLAARTIDLKDQRPFQALDAARHLCTFGGVAEGYVMSCEGFCLAEAGRGEPGRIALLRAANRLSEYTDPRELALVYYSVSRIGLRRYDRSDALRYAVAAAVLHPFGLILEHCRERIAKAASSEVAAVMSDLRKGSSKPFAAVQKVLGRVAGSSGLNTGDLIEANLIEILRRREPDGPEPLPIAA